MKLDEDHKGIILIGPLNETKLKLLNCYFTIKTQFNCKQFMPE